MSHIRVYTSEIFTSPPPIEEKEEEEEEAEKEEKIVEKKTKEDARKKLSEIAKKIIEESEQSNDFSFFLCNEILPHLPLPDINIIRTHLQYHAKTMLYLRVEHLVKYCELPQDRKEFHVIFTTLLKKEAAKTRIPSPRCQFSLEANTVRTFFKEENTSENQEEEIEVIIDRELPPLLGEEETFLYHPTPRKRPATHQERIEIENSLPPPTPFRSS
ncbi:MAG: hypothetical protein A3F14_04050 [Gammaproteobacteria bacterium RIFCSPHIGHO2_12_FULL_43_28]|nr:MAG: hypothetical protein A3F14_04050 [Gammaproteobacteria bacterium RIFCSPHIGHO2_12_FULL_43_28]